jgi:hypothetical protein
MGIIVHAVQSVFVIAIVLTLILKYCGTATRDRAAPHPGLVTEVTPHVHLELRLLIGLAGSRGDGCRPDPTDPPRSRRQRHTGVLVEVLA